MNFAQPVEPPLHIARQSRTVGSNEPHPPGTAEHGVTRISGVESLVDNRRDLGKRQTPGKQIP
jgi:hypothetical protein